MGAVSGTDEVGSLVSTTGAVSLAGGLAVTSMVLPSLGSTFAIVDNEGNEMISGIFSKLTAGSSFTVKNGTTIMTFQITYVGNDGDGANNVLITRIS
jgi:hypothetical protein